MPLGDAGQYEYAWVHADRAAASRRRSQDRTCGYGRHEAQQRRAVLGLPSGERAYCASYGYAGGMGSRPINDAKVPVVN